MGFQHELVPQMKQSKLVSDPLSFLFLIKLGVVAFQSKNFQWKEGVIATRASSSKKLVPFALFCSKEFLGNISSQN